MGVAGKPELGRRLGGGGGLFGGGGGALQGEKGVGSSRYRKRQSMSRGGKTAPEGKDVRMTAPSENEAILRSPIKRGRGEVLSRGARKDRGEGGGSKRETV